MTFEHDTVSCPACNAQLPAGNRFCLNCGTAVTSDALPCGLGHTTAAPSTEDSSAAAPGRSCYGCDRARWAGKRSCPDCGHAVQPSVASADKATRGFRRQRYVLGSRSGTTWKQGAAITDYIGEPAALEEPPAVEEVTVEEVTIEEYPIQGSRTEGLATEELLTDELTVESPAVEGPVASDHSAHHHGPDLGGEECILSLSDESANCSACNAALPARSRFCPQCGMALNSDASLVETKPRHSLDAVTDDIGCRTPRSEPSPSAQAEEADDLTCPSCSCAVHPESGYCAQCQQAVPPNSTREDTAVSKRTSERKVPQQPSGKKSDRNDGSWSKTFAQSISGVIVMFVFFSIVLHGPGNVIRVLRGHLPDLPGFSAPSLDASGPSNPSSSASSSTASASAASDIRTVLDLHGSGSKSTESFTAKAPWSLVWQYDCSNFALHQGNLIVTVHNEDGSLSIHNQPVNQLGSGQTSSEMYHQGGMFYPQINSECDWNVSVLTR